MTLDDVGKIVRREKEYRKLFVWKGNQPFSDFVASSFLNWYFLLSLSKGRLAFGTLFGPMVVVYGTIVPNK